MTERIKVMIVDDSAVMRQGLTEILAADPAIEVLGTAPDPAIAFEKMRRRWPDVIFLGLEMPHLEGFSFLKQLLAERPTPTVLCTSHIKAGTPAATEALALGVVTIIALPALGRKQFIDDTAEQIRHTAHHAARPRTSLGDDSPLPQSEAASSHDHLAVHGLPSEPIIAIGTSTGGTQALEAVLIRLAKGTPGIVIVQHMPAMFTGMFAQRLDALSPLDVREAQNGDAVIPGRALVAPGGKQMTLQHRGTQYFVEVTDDPPFNRHRPSVDILFHSVARNAGANALGIIMTGMGDDGAHGLKEMHDAGAQTIAQDEASCVVFGMPKEAIKLGAVDHVLPLGQIPEAIAHFGHTRHKGEF